MQFRSLPADFYVMCASQTWIGSKSKAAQHLVHQILPIDGDYVNAVVSEAKWAIGKGKVTYEGVDT